MGRHGCAKVRYRDRIAALMALERATRRAHRGRREVRAYRCDRPECKGAWHLTSIARRNRSGT
jgi:hypothetical protein